MHIGFRHPLLATAALAAISSAALAADKPASLTAAQQLRLDDLARQVEALNRQVRQLRQAQADGDSSAALSDLKRSTSDRYADIKNRFDALPKAAIDNGRFTFASADGSFSLALRALMQFDIGHFAQGRGPANVDLNSGTNFRRAQLGFQGVVFKDWSYNFTYDFGGYGVEGRGYVYNAYVQYDGLKPVFFRIGAYTPPEGQEDQTGSGDLLFPERASAVDLARNLAGAPSREAATIYAQGDTYFLSLSYTGKKTGDGTSTGTAVGTFDAQQSLIGRAAWLAVATPQAKWLIEGHITDVLKVADPTPGPAATVIRFSNGPEVAVDASKTVDTGNIDAKQVREFGFETAGTYGDFYMQAGFFRYEITRRLALQGPHFSGWYALAAYSLTGETHSYDPLTASFRNLRPARPLGTPGGWGAFELAARYSNADLDFHPLLSSAAGGVAGGRQDIWTVGLNWYPDAAIKFQLDYNNIKVGHVNAPATDISADAIVLRSQISL